MHFNQLDEVLKNINKRGSHVAAWRRSGGEAGKGGRGGEKVHMPRGPSATSTLSNVVLASCLASTFTYFFIQGSLTTGDPFIHLLSKKGGGWMNTMSMAELTTTKLNAESHLLLVRH